MYALIYTRSHSVDYRYFSGPHELRADEEVDEHIRNVMHEDDGGLVGDLVGKRWHVFRKDKWLIIGMATKDFGRVDETGVRSIRGYYGFAMTADEAKIPSQQMFEEIDRRFVLPFFHQSSITPSEGFVSGGIFDDELQYIQPVDFGRWPFNADPSRVRFHVSEDVDALLRSAVAYAVKINRFEIVIGLNTVAHAMRLPICNCLCKDVVTGRDQAVIRAEESPMTGQRSDQTNFSGRECGRSPREQHCEDVSCSGSKGRRLDESKGMGGMPLFGGRRGRDSVIRDDVGGKRARRVVIDIVNESEHDNGFWRELLSAVNRILVLFGIKAKCKIEESNDAPQRRPNSATEKPLADKKVARSYLESGF